MKIDFDFGALIKKLRIGKISSGMIFFAIIFSIICYFFYKLINSNPVQLKDFNYSAILWWIALFPTTVILGYVFLEKIISKNE